MNPTAGITGLAGNILNSQYNSALGNTLQQNLAGSQTENVFGSSVWTFINLIRIFQNAKLVDEKGNEPITGAENPLGSVEQYKTIKWVPTEKSTFYQRLAYLFKVHLPFVGEMKVPSPVDFGITGEEGWNGFTRVHVGDVSNLHYKGTIYDTYRACNHIKYNYGQGFDGKYNPLFFDADSVPENPSSADQKIVESKDFFQAQLESFANTQWRIGVVVSWAFSEYSNLVSTDQAVSGNKAWEIANMAFELAQFLVLHQLGSYQEDWINNIMNKEIELGTEAKLDETQIFASIANIKSMEEKLTTDFNGLIVDLNSKNLLAEGALADLLTKVGSLHEEIENTTKEANQNLVAEYTAKIKALEATIESDSDRGVPVLDTTLWLVDTMKRELERIKLWFSKIEEDQASQEIKSATPSSQNEVPTTNGETTGTIAAEAISLNPGADSATEITESQSALAEGSVTLPSDFNLALAKETFVIFEQQANLLLSRMDAAVASSENPAPEPTQNVQSSSAPPKRVWGIKRLARSLGLIQKKA